MLRSLLPLLALLHIVGAALENIHVNRETHGFIGDSGRTHLFHGVNAVYKVAPWHPTTTGFDSENTLSDVDAANLKAWGFNIVRLGVMWPGLEPKERGNYNQSYLDQIETIVTNLAKNDTYVILDLHQDLWHRKFCGEGVPDYVYESCKRAEPAGTPYFPLPAVNVSEPYPLDADGNPTLEACLSTMFATYYLSAEVSAGFQCLYDNTDNMWDAFANFWVQVATRFKSTQAVLGYELLNEPWVGNVFESPKRILPEVAEKQYLQPLYEYVHKALRVVDDSKIIFFEGLTIDYWQSGFSAGPGGESYNDRQALAYHIYCPIQNPNVKIEIACQAIDDEFFIMRNKDIDRMGGGMIMTEFGAAEDIKGDIYALEKLVELMDKHQQSWMYWQFKYYQDITTCTPQGESLYNDDGTPCEDKLNVLTRTYPQVTAGTLKSYKFYKETGRFVMNYALPDTATRTLDALARTTEIYYNKDTFYPHGIAVSVEGSKASAVTVTCPSLIAKKNEGTILKLVTQSGVSVDDDSTVTVTVARCINPLIPPLSPIPIEQTCTCR